mmetsp:Transcript_106780/g.340057  ORF Transcript_106780/g.340057 Transcript_106780/m.340057 type:complete len:206 (+) Transcript_106780:776-1393(+)
MASAASCSTAARMYLAARSAALSPVRPLLAPDALDRDGEVSRGTWLPPSVPRPMPAPVTAAPAAAPAASMVARSREISWARVRRSRSIACAKLLESSCLCTSLCSARLAISVWRCLLSSHSRSIIKSATLCRMLVATPCNREEICATNAGGKPADSGETDGASAEPKTSSVMPLLSLSSAMAEESRADHLVEGPSSSSNGRPWEL